MRPTSPLVACFLPRWVGAVRWIGQNESVKATIEVGVASSSISCSAGARNPVRYQPDGDALSMRSPHPRGGGGGNPSGSRSLNPLRSRPHIRLQAPARRRYAKHSRMTLLSTRTGETNDVWRLGRIDVLDEPFTAAQRQEIADLGSNCCGHAEPSRTVKAALSLYDAFKGKWASARSERFSGINPARLHGHLQMLIASACKNWRFSMRSWSRTLACTDSHRVAQRLLLDCCFIQCL